MDSQLRAMINEIGDLPPMPVVAVKVMKLLQEPTTDADLLARTISADAAVSAQILKIANSSFYSMSRQIKSLENAIVILGEKTLKSVLLAASLKGVNKRYGLLEKMFWEDSIGCAIGSRLIASKIPGIDAEEAFLAGLFRHLGKVVMNNWKPQDYLEVVQASYKKSGRISELEREHFPFTHAQVGAAVLEKWYFDPSLVSAVLHHSDLSIEPGDDMTAYHLAAIVNISGALCRILGIGQRSPDQELAPERTEGAYALGMDRVRCDEILAEMQSVFEANQEFFAS